jgi:hypothetical protein
MVSQHGQVMLTRMVNTRNPIRLTLVKGRTLQVKEILLTEVMLHFKTKRKLKDSRISFEAGQLIILKTVVVFFF